MSRRKNVRDVAARLRRINSSLESLEKRLLFCADPGLHQAMGLPLDQHLSLTQSLSEDQWQTYTTRAQSAVGGAGASAGGATTPISLSQINFSTRADGMPILNSLSTAPAAVYLDFDGGTTGGDTFGAYDRDGNPSNFNTQEQAEIAEAWRHMSMYFAMFNVNVTTIDPTVPKAWILVTNDYSGGVSGVDVFPNTVDPASLAGDGFARTRVSGIAHEIGHNFGTWHTAEYNNLGEKTAEYADEFDPLHGPIMGVDYDGIIHKWTTWHDSIDATRLQDDIAIIKADLDALDGSGDGFKADDDPDGSLSTPIAMTVNGNVQVATGVIERLDDADVFSFTISSAGNYTISALRDMPSGVDLKVELYNNSGILLSSEDGDPRAVPYTMVNDHHQSWNMSAGTYKIKVMSHGNYGDVGQYIVRLDPLSNVANPNGTPVRWQNSDVGLVGIGGITNYNSGTSTWTLMGSGHDLGPEEDAFHYAYQPLEGDGSITVRVTGLTNTSNWAMGGVMMRETLEPGSKEASIAMTYNRGAILNWRDTTNAAGSATTSGTAAFTATWVRITRTGNNFVMEKSATGAAGSWTQFGTTKTIAMNSKIYVGLFSCGVNNAALNSATFTNLALTGTINPQLNTSGAPANPTLTAGTTTSNSVNLSWTNVTGESGYAIERSTDGLDANAIVVGTTAANITTFTDNGLSDGQRYWYRVRSKGTGSVVSTGSNQVNATTKAGAVSNPNVISYSTNTLIIDWTDASGESSYKIQRSSNGTTGWTDVGTVGRNVPSFNNSGLSTGTRYYYRIQTLQGATVTATSAVVNAYTRSNAVSGLAFTTKTSSQMTIAWNAVSGATYRVEKSENGVDWDEVSASQSGTTYNDTSITPLGEYYYRVTALKSTTTSMPATIFAAAPASTSQALPSGWTTVDIGSVGGTGAAGKSSGVFTLVGSGSDMEDTDDQLRYAYTTTTGATWIEARVASHGGSQYWSMSGVMIRESNAVGSKFAAVMIGDSGYWFAYRSTTNGTVTWVDGPDVAAPYQISVERNGSTITAWGLAPGDPFWTALFTANVSMTNSVEIGLFVCGYDNTQLTTSTFDLVQTNFSGGVLMSMPGGGSSTTKASNLVVSAPRKKAKTAEPPLFSAIPIAQKSTKTADSQSVVAATTLLKTSKRLV